MAATVLAVLFLLLTAASPTATAPAFRAGSGVRAAAVTPLGIPANQFDINRSQSSGTYVAEYVSLNNSSTLTKLPYIATANGCKWVTVLNLSVKVDTFHYVRYAQVTAGNNTGTQLAGIGQTAFKACAGSTFFVDYTYWTYSDYVFSTSTLGNTQTAPISQAGLANLTLVYETPTGYAGAKKAWLNTTYAFDTNHAVSLLVSLNTSFQVALPASARSPTACDVTGQICSYPQWTFVSASSGANVSTSVTLTFAQPLTAAYHNWTAGYSETNVSANGLFGGFFSATGSFVTVWIVNLWWAWVILIVVAILAVALYRRERRGRSRA